MNAFEASGVEYLMETCPDCITYRPARRSRGLRRRLERLGMPAISRRPARRPRGLRRRLERLGTLALALAFAVSVVTLMFIGEHWLLVDAKTSGIELGVAVQAAHAAGFN
jgi:hypothetical protein